MASTFCKTVFCLAASVALCGAPALAQEQIGAPGSPAGQNGSGSTSTGSATSSTGSMSGSSAGNMQGSSAGMDNSSMAGGSGKLTAEDKHFMKTAMEGDMAEIQLGQLALQKASNDRVKQFAQRMVDDHTKLDAQMKPMAQQFGVDAPADLSAKHKALAAKLQGLSGEKFDQEYIRSMVADHREDDQEFLREESMAKNPELKNAVSQGEPIIADHLRMAQDIEKSMKGKS